MTSPYMYMVLANVINSESIVQTLCNAKKPANPVQYTASRSLIYFVI